jgi:hypothetical protein
LPGWIALAIVLAVGTWPMTPAILSDVATIERIATIEAELKMLRVDAYRRAGIPLPTRKSTDLVASSNSPEWLSAVADGAILGRYARRPRSCAQGMPIAWVSREAFGLSSTVDIGRALGDRDHSTILMPPSAALQNCARSTTTIRDVTDRLLALVIPKKSQEEEGENAPGSTKRPVGRRSTFDVAGKDRRLLIAKIHVAKKEMALLDDDYRQMLLDETGRASSADCTVPELRAMVEAMKKKGFQPKTSSKRAADHPFATKARALWISLYHLGAIDNPSEQALEAFARRQLKCERMQWANQAQGYKLIEALKAIAERNGWEQRITSTLGMKPVAADVALRILKVRLVERIAHLLGERRLVPVDMPLGQIAWQLAGMERDGRWPVGPRRPRPAGQGARAKAAGDKR